MRRSLQCESPPKRLRRVLPVLQCGLGTPVCSPWLSGRPAGIPRFLSRLQRTHNYTQIHEHRPMGGCALRASFHFKCWVCSSEDAAFLCVLRCPLFTSSLLFLSSSPPPQLVEKSLCIVARIPTSFILHRLHSTVSLPLLSLSECRSISFQRQTKHLSGIHPFLLSKQD